MAERFERAVMSWRSIHDGWRRKRFRAAQLGKFIFLIGTFYLVSDLAIQSVSHWPHDFDSISALTKAMADDDDDGGGGDDSGGGSGSGSSDSGKSRSSGEGRKRLIGRVSSRGLERNDDDDAFERGDRGEFERNDDDDDDNDNDDFDLDDGPLGALGKVFKRLTGSPKSERSRHRGRDFYAPRGRNEILAINLGRNGAKNARKLGFKIGGSNQFSHLPGSVTRLIPPGKLTGAQARDLLKRAQPNGRFSVNQRYTYYHPALKDESEQNGQTESAKYGLGSLCAATKCFGRQMIRWHEEIQSCASGLRVGIIDTQVDHQHPAFAKADIHLGGFLPNGVKAAPAWHGTGVLSVLAGDIDSGTPGLIPQASFYAASVFFLDNKGEVGTDTVSVLDALEWMSAFDVKVINMSFSGPKDELVEETIERMSREGVIFIAAAGNGGPTTELAYPAAYPSVIAVTAVSKDLRNYPYASRGNNLDAAAPGVNIWSAVPGSREGFHTGTSFAAPYVAAMLATVYEDARHARNKEELLNRLEMVDLGPPGRDPIYGRGLMLAPTSCNNANGERIARTTSPPTGNRDRLTVSQAGTGSNRAIPSGNGLSYR